jgi:hypothetical protein
LNFQISDENLYFSANRNFLNIKTIRREKKKRKKKYVNGLEAGGLILAEWMPDHKYRNLFFLSHFCYHTSPVSHFRPATYPPTLIISHLFDVSMII